MEETTVEITEVPAAVAAIKGTRLMMHRGVYLVRGDCDIVIAQAVVEEMMRDDLIHRVGSGMYELTIKGKQYVRNGGVND